MSALVIVLVLLAAAIVMFAINKPRLDAVALIMLTALPFTGVLTMGEALAGFSDSNIVLIAALFVIGDGLVRTGVAQQLGDWLIVKAGRSEIRLIVLLMIVVCGLGATMSSTAVTAIFIPVVLRISQTAGIGPGRLMMPLSMAALISGMTTLVATAPNLVVNGELERHGIEGFRFFSFTPFGLPILVLGIIYMSFARRWLTATREVERFRPPEPCRLDRGIQTRRPRIPPSRDGAVAAGGQDAGGAEPAQQLRRQHRGHRAQPQILPGDAAADGEDGTDGRRYPAGRSVRARRNIDTLRQQFALEEMPLSGAYFADRSQEIGMAEVIVPADLRTCRANAGRGRIPHPVRADRGRPAARHRCATRAACSTKR